MKFGKFVKGSLGLRFFIVKGKLVTAIPGISILHVFEVLLVDFVVQQRFIGSALPQAYQVVHQIVGEPGRQIFVVAKELGNLFHQVLVLRTVKLTQLALDHVR